LVAVTDASDLQADKVAAPELAVESEVEECKFVHSVLHLEAHSERPDVSELERYVLADNLAHVRWLAMSNVGYGLNDGLPSSWGPTRLRLGGNDAPATVGTARATPEGQLPGVVLY